MNWFGGNKDGWFNKTFSSPFMTAIIIVVVLLLIIFITCSKYFKKHSRDLFKISIYALLTTCGILFVHDRLMENSIAEKYKKDNLSFVGNRSVTIGKGEIIYPSVSVDAPAIDENLGPDDLDLFDFQPENISS